MRGAMHCSPPPMRCHKIEVRAMEGAILVHEAVRKVMQVFVGNHRVSAVMATVLTTVKTVAITAPTL